MPKRKFQSAWIATLSVSVPISAEKPETVTVAKRSVEELIAALPLGATVEIMRAGFGKMEIQIVTKEDDGLPTADDVRGILAQPEALLNANAPPVRDPDEIPDYMRKVLRQPAA